MRKASDTGPVLKSNWIAWARRGILLVWMLLWGAPMWAHPMPYSVLKLSVLENRIQGSAQVPLPELVVPEKLIFPGLMPKRCLVLLFLP